MKIFYKLLIGFFLIAVLVGGVSIISFANLKKKIEIRIDQISNNSVIEFESAEHMLIALKSCHLSALQLVNFSQNSHYFQSNASEHSENINEIKANLKQFSKHLKLTLNTTELAYKFALKYHDEHMVVDERKELDILLYPLQEIFDQYQASMLKFVQLADVDISAARQLLSAQIENQRFYKMISLINKIRKDAREEMHSEISDIIDIYIPRATRIIVGSIFISLLIAVILGYFIARSISKPIMALEAAALKVGRGQLDVRVELTSEDEIGVLGRTFNQMVLDLNHTTISKIFLDNIIESMLDALIVISPDLTIQMVNDAACQLSGYNKIDLIGKSITWLIDTEASESLIFGHLQIDSVLKNIELNCVTKQNKRIPILFSATVLVKEGQAYSIVCVARDIQEMKTAENDLREAYDKLEERVERRTIDLAQTAQRLRQELLEHRATSVALRQSERQLRYLSYSVLKAQEEERKRLANELHDELGQSLSLLKMQLGAIQRKLPHGQAILADEVKEMRLYLNQVIEDVRRLSRDLSPSLLSDLGLSTALEKIGKDFAKYHPISVSFKTTTIDHLFSQNTQIMIYRMFQEIFTNIAKHAKASHVQVEISKHHDNVKMTIGDDGQGFDPTAANYQEPINIGLGLTSLKERARMINADFDLWSEKGVGTRLQFTIPILKREPI